MLGLLYSTVQPANAGVTDEKVPEMEPASMTVITSPMVGEYPMLRFKLPLREAEPLAVILS